MEGTERGIRRWCEEENVIRLRVLIKAVSLNLLHTKKWMPVQVGSSLLFEYIVNHGIGLSCRGG